MTDTLYNARLSERLRIADRLDEMAREYQALAERSKGPSEWRYECIAEAFFDAAEELRRQE